MRGIVLWVRARLAREWSEIPPDERSALFGSLVAAVAIPLVLTLVVDATGALLRPLLLWLLILFLPVWVLARVIHRWLVADEPFLRAVIQDLRPDPLGNWLALEGRGLQRLPSLTFGLIAVNVALHYSVADPWDYAMRMADPSLWLWTNFTAMFSHGSEEHLWGNMLFLWIFGSEVEPRLGRVRYLAYYLIVGSAGNVAAVAFYLWTAGEDWMKALGASGAISGVMGLFIVRCYFARVGVAIPIFGPLGVALPVAYRLQVNALVLVGLYFCLDLMGARADLVGERTHVGHMAHLGGYCLGLCIAFGTGLAREGRRELLELEASRPPDPDGFGPDPEARDRVLALDPENLPLRIARARAGSKYVLREKGRNDYETAIRSLLKSDPTEAARVFTEYFARYGVPLAPKHQLALTSALVRIGAVDAAARALELAAETPGISREERELALLNQARLLSRMGLEEAAAHVYEKLVLEHPDGAASAEAKRQLARVGAPASGAS